MGQSVAENRYGAVSELGPRDNKSITGPGIYQLKGDLQAYINTKRSANNTPIKATQAIHRVHSMEPFEFLNFGEEYGERQLSFQTPGRSHKLYIRLAGLRIAAKSIQLVAIPRNAYISVSVFEL